MKDRRRGGFSLVEVVIALTVIVVVSVTGLSIALSSVATKESAKNKSYAQNLADNVWECFKAADDVAEFLRLAEFAGCELTLNEDGTYSYSHPDYNFDSQITVDYNSEDGTPRPTLDILITDKDGGREIISFTYKKGAK